jgi:hypothetical protein
MQQVELTVEEAVRLATKRVLPAGFKPEDYLIVTGSSDIPRRIAMMIVLEAQHLLKMEQLWK